MLAYGIGFALVCVVNLYPLYRADQIGAAFTNLVLLLFVPFLVEHSKRKKGLAKFGLRAFVAASLYACYFNSVGGVSEGRDTHIEQKVDVQGQIGTWEAKIVSLRTEDGRIPDHKPINERQYLDSKEKRDEANRTRDRECSPEFTQAHLKDKTKSQEACDKDREKADKAQADFDDASLRWGYEQAHKENIDAIEAARAEIRKLGPKPVAADPSADKISRIITFGMISAQWLSDLMPLLLALLADLAYAIASPIVAKEIEHTMLGEDDQKKITTEGKSLPEIELATVQTVHEGFETVQRTVQPEPQTLQPDEAQTIQPRLLPPPQGNELKPARRESVGEWFNARMNRSKNRSIPAGQAYAWYCAYAKEIGENPVTQALFGREMRKLGIEKKEGSYPAYLGIAPKPALVMASAVE